MCKSCRDGCVSRSRSTTEAALRAELAEIRARGLAFNHGENAEGYRGMSAPAFGADGSPAGAIAVAVVRERFTPEFQAHAGATLLSSAGELSAALDYRGSPELTAIA